MYSLLKLISKIVAPSYFYFVTSSNIIVLKNNITADLLISSVNLD